MKDTTNGYFQVKILTFQMNRSSRSITDFISILPYMVPTQNSFNLKKSWQLGTCRKKKISELVSDLSTGDSLSSYNSRNFSDKEKNLICSWRKYFMRSGDSYRIREHFKLERTLNGHLVYLPFKKQGCLQLNQVAQRPTQPDLGCLQGQGINHLSGQPAPDLHCPYHQKCFHSY